MSKKKLLVSTPARPSSWFRRTNDKSNTIPDFFLNLKKERDNKIIKNYNFKIIFPHPILSFHKSSYQLTKFLFLDSPKYFWILHWTAWINALVGVCMILLAHGHYTIDIIVAYYVTTRLFWTYHTLANNSLLLKVIEFDWNFLCCRIKKKLSSLKQKDLIYLMTQFDRFLIWSFFFTYIAKWIQFTST